MQVEHKLIKTIGILSLLYIAAISCPKISLANYEKAKNEKSVFIDKRVRSLEMENYVDNLEVQTKKFKKGDLIEFTVYIENNGLTELNNIVIRDFLPSNLKPVLYDGTYNKADHTIEWKIDVLLPTHNKKYLIRASILNDNQANGAYTNTVKAFNDQAADQDTSSYFVGSVVSTTKTIPQSGPSDLIIQTVLSLSAIAGAIGIRKYARGY